jgi:nitrogen fixation protein FixH
VEGKKVKLRSDGTFTVRYALPPGEFKFEVEATSKNKKHKRKTIPAVKRYNR